MITSTYIRVHFCDVDFTIQMEFFSSWSGKRKRKIFKEEVFKEASTFRTIKKY